MNSTNAQDSSNLWQKHIESWLTAFWINMRYLNKWFLNGAHLLKLDDALRLSKRLFIFSRKSGINHNTSEKNRCFVEIHYSQTNCSYPNISIPPYKERCCDTSPDVWECEIIVLWLYIPCGGFSLAPLLSSPAWTNFLLT